MYDNKAYMGAYPEAWGAIGQHNYRGDIARQQVRLQEDVARRERCLTDRERWRRFDYPGPDPEPEGYSLPRLLRALRQHGFHLPADTTAGNVLERLLVVATVVAGRVQAEERGERPLISFDPKDHEHYQLPDDPDAARRWQKHERDSKAREAAEKMISDDDTAALERAVAANDQETALEILASQGVKDAQEKLARLRAARQSRAGAR